MPHKFHTQFVHSCIMHICGSVQGRHDVHGVLLVGWLVKSCSALLCSSPAQDLWGNM